MGGGGDLQEKNSYIFCFYLFIFFSPGYLRGGFPQAGPNQGKKIPPGGRQCFEATVHVEFDEMLRFENGP